MKYYKSEAGEVFAYEADGSQDDFIKPGLARMTDAEVQAHLNPPVHVPTYQEELQTLNAEYQKDVEAFNKAFSLAILFDGVTEEAKKASIREQYNNRKQKYVSDMTALKTKHGV